ncbi:MAG: cysteine desulfurase [Proteobacteria bacterium]|nr:cysteine desulfurase [Pseudomonadota bacterium]
MIYLDYNANAPLGKGVKEAMCSALDHFGNPSSIHQSGKKAKAIINKTREILGDYLDVPPQNLIFTSGGTEANAMALRGVDADVFLVSSIEHASVFQTAQHHPNAHFQKIPVNSQGIIDLEALTSLLKSVQGKKVLVSVMMANNECGVIEPISEIREIVHKHAALMHVDAAQSLGKIPISQEDLKVDLMSFSGHKIGGPMGVGALYIREGLPFKGLYEGGGQERRLRSGTENVSGIAGFGKAIENIDLPKWEVIKSHRLFLESTLREKFSDLFIASDKVSRLPNTTLMSRPSLPSSTQVIQLDLEGICVSSGASCSSGVVKGFSVLKAMGVRQEIVSSVIRISLGPETGREDIERFITVYSHIQGKS